MDVDLIFKIAAIGILVAVLNQVLSRAGRDEQAMMTTLAGLVVATFVASLYNMDAFNALYYTLLGFVLLRFGCWLYVRRKY